MSYSVLEKELETLPQAAVDEVVDFIRFMKLRYSEEQSVISKKSMYGIWKNDPFYMSDDFDEPLEDFAEYM